MSVPENAAGSVAVVIPCHNDGAFVSEAVESALIQGAGEIVVVDDGSTDTGTIAALERLDPRAKVLRKENSGPAGARSTGVAATSAPFVLALDADDTLCPGALDALARALIDHPSLAIVWGDARSTGLHEGRSRTPDTLDPWRITFLNEIQASALVRREALDSVGGWGTRSGFEDWDLWMSLAQGGYQGARVPIVSFNYRQHRRGAARGTEVTGWHGPRTSQAYKSRHNDLALLLRANHPRLFAERGVNRRWSNASAAIKLTFELIDRLPRLSFAEKAKMYAIASYALEPRMWSSSPPGAAALERRWRTLKSRLSRRR